MTGQLIHLLRHGAPETAGLLLGHDDNPSTPAGIEACMTRATDLEVDAIVASDLGRAVRAAEAIGNLRSLPVTVDPRWRELGFGEWDGRASDELDRQALDRFWDDPDAFPPPGGERWSSLLARVEAALGDLPSGPVLVVTHGGAMRAALSVLCGLDYRHGWLFDLPYAALLSVRAWRNDGFSGQIVGLRT